MKICFFTTGVFAVDGKNTKAIENWTFNLARVLKERGHKITLFSAANSSGMFDVVAPDEAMTQEVALGNPSGYKNYLKNYFLKCLNWSKENSVDLIHDQTSSAEVLALVNSSGTPVASTFHVIRNKPEDHQQYLGLDHVYNISPSKYLAQASAPLKFYKVIYHGIDTNFFKYNSNPKNGCIYVGKIIESKGTMLAVEAAKSEGFELTICGSPMLGKDNENYFEQFNRAIEGVSNINYLGQVNRETVAALMGDSRVLLMPALEPEAFGLVMAEALSCGTPVIASNIGTAKEIVKDDLVGYLFEPGNNSKMIDKLSKIDEINRQECRDYIGKHFSHDRMVSEYEKVYEEILENEKRRKFTKVQ